MGCGRGGGRRCTDADLVLAAAVGVAFTLKITPLTVLTKQLMSDGTLRAMGTIARKRGE